MLQVVEKNMNMNIFCIEAIERLCNTKYFIWWWKIPLMLARYYMVNSWWIYLGFAGSYSAKYWYWKLYNAYWFVCGWNSIYIGEISHILSDKLDKTIVERIKYEVYRRVLKPYLSGRKNSWDCLGITGLPYVPEV